MQDGYYRCKDRKRTCAHQQYNNLRPIAVGNFMWSIQDDPVMWLRAELSAPDRNDRVYRVQFTEINQRFGPDKRRFKMYVMGIVGLLNWVDAVDAEGPAALVEKDVSVRLVKILPPPVAYVYEPPEQFTREEKISRWHDDYGISGLTDEQKDLRFRDKVDELQTM